MCRDKNRHDEDDNINKNGGLIVGLLAVTTNGCRKYNGLLSTALLYVDFDVDAAKHVVTKTRSNIKRRLPLNKSTSMLTRKKLQKLI